MQEGGFQYKDEDNEVEWKGHKTIAMETMNTEKPILL